MNALTDLTKSLAFIRRTDRWLLGLVLLGVAVVYGFALQADLFFDDLPSLVENIPLHIDGRSFDGWRTAAFSSDAGRFHRPVAMLTFAANHALFGGISPVSLRFTNLVIHLMIAVLIYSLALRIFSAPAIRKGAVTNVRMAALAAAAVWVLHPLHVSTVLYAVQRMAQLSTLFTILALCVFMHYRLRWAERGATTGEMLAAGLWLALIVAIATLSKENGALIPWLIAAVEVTLFRGCWKKAQATSLFWLGWAALLAPLALMLVILLDSPEVFTAGYQQRDFTMVERLLTQARLLWQYLSWLFLPDITAMGFHHDDIQISQSLLQPITTLVAFLSWAAVSIVAFLLRRRYPLLFFALLFFLIAHVMESTVLALEMVFEHRNYLPSIGVCFLFSQILLLSISKIGKSRAWLPLLSVLGILFVLLILRTQVWSSQLLLAQSNVINHPSSARAHYFYADALLESYRRRQEKGLDESDGGEGSKTIMVAVRHHLLRMHEEAPDGAIAIVKLLTIDSYYFPGLVEQHDWMSVLEEALESRVLQASDLGALSLLVECVGTDGCDIPFDRVGALLDKMIARNPQEVWLQLSKYQLQVAADASSIERLQTLDKAAAVSPRHPSIQTYRIREKGQLGDVAGMYEVVRYWLFHDSKRRDLRSIMPFFTVTERIVAPLSEMEARPSPET